MTSVLKGYFLVKQIALKKVEYGTSLLAGTGIENFLYQLAWQGAIKRKLGEKKVTAFVTAEQAEILKLFASEVDEVHIVSNSDMDNIVEFYKTEIGRIFRRKNPEIICSKLDISFHKDLFVEPTWLNFGLMMKSILHLPLELAPLEGVCLNRLIKRRWEYNDSILLSFAKSDLTREDLYRKMCEDNGFKAVLLSNEMESRNSSDYWRIIIELIESCKGVIGDNTRTLNLAGVLKKQCFCIGLADSYNNPINWGHHMSASQNKTINQWFREISGIQL